MKTHRVRRQHSNCKSQQSLCNGRRHLNRQWGQRGSTRCLLNDLTCKRGSVGQSEGLSIPRSSVRFCLKPDTSNSHEFELHRPSNKGTKLLLKVIKAIIIISHGCILAPSEVRADAHEAEFVSLSADAIDGAHRAPGAPTLGSGPACACVFRMGCTCSRDRPWGPRAR